MEKPLVQLNSRSRLRIKVTPKILREVADRIEAELKNNTSHNWEAEVDFTNTITLFAEHEPEPKAYSSSSSDDETSRGRPLQTVVS